uniref:NADH dehydrogenase subunit 6 n=1 Tax=Cheumatopsyche charites TaxID=1875285 RepID=UPI0022DCDF32|nr:NADH dehydrogenase subunit 6 [Cheumatopsyche charites]UZZ43841.1 NADH dehydrogenase subunit 6 [Cheumatopsyche charites]
MLKLMMLNLIVLTSSAMMIIKIPLNLGLTILIQTLIYSIILNINTNIYWISYILYLILLGGMLILFLYMCSISSNEIIKLNLNWFMFYMMFSFLFLLLSKNFYWLNNMLKNKFNLNLFFNMETLTNISKIYNNFSMMITIIMIIYLLISLMMVSMFTNTTYGPLRTSR